MDVKRIEDIFSGMAARLHGVRDVVLLTDDGYPVAGVRQSGEQESLAAAVGSLINDSGERGAAELNLGKIDLQVTVGSAGYCVMKRLLPGSLMLIVADNPVSPPPLGMVLLLIRQAEPELLSAMREN
jgi:predicted regulator of Ras-like GTPase activity (Roadblock/LC7/MglB family)